MIEAPRLLKPLSWYLRQISLSPPSSYFHAELLDNYPYLSAHTWVIGFSECRPIKGSRTSDVKGISRFTSLCLLCLPGRRRLGAFWYTHSLSLRRLQCEQAGLWPLHLNRKFSISSFWSVCEMHDLLEFLESTKVTCNGSFWQKPSAKFKPFLNTAFLRPLLLPVLVSILPHQIIGISRPSRPSSLLLG